MNVSRGKPDSALARTATISLLKNGNTKSNVDIAAMAAVFAQVLENSNLRRMNGRLLIREGEVYFMALNQTGKTQNTLPGN